MAKSEIIEPRKTGMALANWQDFEVALNDRQADIDAMLPRNIPLAKFQATAIAAVKQNPELLECTTRSLMSAITRSAQDGILPDGREGVINSYNTKVPKKGQPDRWEKQAQWNPMAHGLRKRARETDGILIDAQVIYQNDTFTWEQGDRPLIGHIPAPLGTPRGDKIGAYAIFKREDGTILAREVMAKDEITKVREQSKAPDSLMWTKFEGEAWRKTVLRRGIKSVPVSEELESIVRRDDENFTFVQNADVVSTGEAIPPRPKKSEFERPASKIETAVTKAAAPTTPVEPEQERPRNVACEMCGDEFDIQPRSTCPRCGSTVFKPRATGKVKETPPAAAKPQETGKPDEPEEAQDTEEEAVVEQPEEDDGAGAALAAALEDAYKGYLLELEQCARIRDVTDLRERVQPDLDSAEREKHWLKACEMRQLEIVNASRKKK